MYKVVTIFRGSGVQTEIDLKEYSTAFELAEKIKELGGEGLIVKIETETEIKSNKFNDHILERFTRRD